MTFHIQSFIRTAAALLAAGLIAIALMPASVSAQTRGCEFNCVRSNPMPGSRPNTAPQTGILQNLTDPTIINILPGEVVNRDAINRPPSQPNIQILGQTGPNGQNPPGNPPSITRINGMPPAGETRFVPDQVLVYSRGPLSQQVLDQIAALGVTLVEQQSLTVVGFYSYLFRINDVGTISVRDAIRLIQGLALANVPLIQPNYLFLTAQQRQAPVPAAAGQTAQEGDPAQYVVEKLKLSEVHRLVKGNNIIIAVIDSEIDAGHPDLAGVVAQRFSAVGAPEKPHPHGTGMAGAIASHQKLIGIAPGARLLAVHAFSSKAATAESTTFQILKGIDWSVLQGARVINMSFAGPRDPSMERALKAAYDRNVVLVAAAGNAGPKSPPLFPGADPNVIAVTATDVDNKVFSGANRGRYVAIAAPGVDILVPAPADTYQLTTGTSVASAEVSGVVALMLERNPRLRPADVRRILTTTARRLGTGTRDNNFGAGLVDPMKAIAAAGPPRVSSAAPRR
jgi:subtilisin family serine protease